MHAEAEAALGGEAGALTALPPAAARGAPVAVVVREEYQIAAARQAAMGVAQGLGFERVALCHLATAATELASNLVLHAAGGEVRIRALAGEGGRPGVEVEAVDTGPGIPDLALALSDGYSSRGGLGSGLPGARRLADEFFIESAPGRGTRVVIRIWSRRSAA